MIKIWHVQRRCLVTEETDQVVRAEYTITPSLVERDDAADDDDETIVSPYGPLSSKSFRLPYLRSSMSKNASMRSPLDARVRNVLRR